MSQYISSLKEFKVYRLHLIYHHWIISLKIEIIDILLKNTYSFPLHRDKNPLMISDSTQRSQHIECWHCLNLTFLHAAFTVWQFHGDWVWESALSVLDIQGCVQFLLFLCYPLFLWIGNCFLSFFHIVFISCANIKQPFLVHNILSQHLLAQRYRITMYASCLQRYQR